MKTAGALLMWVSGAMLALGMFCVVPLRAPEMVSAEVREAQFDLSSCYIIADDCSTSSANLQRAIERVVSDLPNPIIVYGLLMIGALLLIIGAIMYAAGRIEESLKRPA